MSHASFKEIYGVHVITKLQDKVEDIIRLLPWETLLSLGCPSVQLVKHAASSGLLMWHPIRMKVGSQMVLCYALGEPLCDLYFVLADLLFVSVTKPFRKTVFRG